MATTTAIVGISPGNVEGVTRIVSFVDPSDEEFTGTIEGIRFKSGSARILHSSRRTLNAAVAEADLPPSPRVPAASLAASAS